MKSFFLSNQNMRLPYHFIKLLANISLVLIQWFEWLFSDIINQYRNILVIYTHAGRFVARGGCRQCHLEIIGEFVGILDIQRDVHQLQYHENIYHTDYVQSVDVVNRAFI